MSRISIRRGPQQDRAGWAREGKAWRREDKRTIGNSEEWVGSQRVEWTNSRFKSRLFLCMYELKSQFSDMENKDNDRTLQDWRRRYSRDYRGPAWHMAEQKIYTCPLVSHYFKAREYRNYSLIKAIVGHSESFKMWIQKPKQIWAVAHWASFV